MFDAAPAAPDGRDLTPPSPVATLTATGGAAVTLSWALPTDATEVLLVRRLLDPVMAAPVAGLGYAAGDALGVGDEVIYTGAGTSFIDADAPPGLLHYAAFARDAAANWAAPAARARALRDVPAQTATLSIALDGTVTVVAQPAHYQLAGAATYDDGGNALNVSLTATSGIARNVFNPKALITSVTGGAAVGDGTLDTAPYVRLGLAVGFGANATGTLLLTGVDGTVDPVLVSLTVIDHAAAISFLTYDNTVAYEVLDTGTMSSNGTVACDAVAFTRPGGSVGNGYCAYRPGGMTSDGRWLFGGSRSLPIVRKIDLGSQDVAEVLTLNTGGQLGATRAMALTHDDATLYVALVIGGHGYWGDVKTTVAATEDLVLVRVDAATMTETGRLVLVDDQPQGAARLSHVAVAPDGAQVVVVQRGTNAATSALRFIDTATFAEIDTDPATAGTQALNLEPVLGSAIKQVVYASGGLYVQDDQAAMLARVDPGTFATETIAIDGTAVTRSGDLVAAPDGKVYATYRSGAGLVAIDGAAVTPVAAPVTDRGTGLAVLGDRLWVTTLGDTIEVYDRATLTRVAGDGQALAVNASHGLFVTPF